MGCNSQYMESTHEERFRKNTHALLAYAYRSLGLPVPDKVKTGANNYYGDGGYSSDDVTSKLCALIRTMNAEDMTRIVYNAKNRDARKLADWWEDHEKADKIRAIEEAKEQQMKNLAQQAAAKLTKQELAALRHSFRA